MINDYSRTSLLFKTDWLILELNENIIQDNLEYLKELNLIREYLLLGRNDVNAEEECLEKIKDRLSLINSVLGSHIFSD